MQFHHHGYVSTNPRVLPAAGVGLNRPEELPEEMDVLIVGSGPAGMVTHAQLAHFPGVTSRIIERRPERLAIGQADGIQARSVETFQAFDFANEIIDEAYQITEMVFWQPSSDDPSRIARASIAKDDPDNISEFPHLIVNQARVLDYFAEFAERGPARGKVDYGYEFLGLENTGEGEYPLRVTLRRTGGDVAGGAAAGAELTVRTKFVVGADGARSGVRKSIGGSMQGDQAYHAWGVMDVLAVTDFPDIRKKCAIQSEDGGNILHIPREGNHLFRMYVDLGEVDHEDYGKVRETSIGQIIARANAILYPYQLDVRNVVWHSVYEVAHRLTDRFDDATEGRDPRVFLLGDACHTHSAKAGQGMNVSMQDGWNLGWKLGYVLDGRSPERLLRSYSDERQIIAKNLIDFDKEWSTLMAKPVEEFDSPTELADFYTATAEFPAGFMTQYQQSALTQGADHQALAAGFPLGKRFKSEWTTRVSDAVRVHLGHHHRADGRYRIYAFADRDSNKLAAWAEWMRNAPESPILRFTPGITAGADIDGIFDVKAVYQQEHHGVDIAAVPQLFLPLSGPFQLIDYEKVYAAEAENDIFESRSVSRDGAVIVVRPDHYVAGVFPLEAGAAGTGALAEFMGSVLLER